MRERPLFYKSCIIDCSSQWSSEFFDLIYLLPISGYHFTNKWYIFLSFFICLSLFNFDSFTFFFCYITSRYNVRKNFKLQELPFLSRARSSPFTKWVCSTSPPRYLLRSISACFWTAVGCGIVSSLRKLIHFPVSGLHTLRRELRCDILPNLPQ